jgi:hypothetical protein
MAGPGANASPGDLVLRSRLPATVAYLLLARLS